MTDTINRNNIIDIKIYCKGFSQRSRQTECSESGPGKTEAFSRSEQNVTEGGVMNSSIPPTRIKTDPATREQLIHTRNMIRNMIDSRLEPGTSSRQVNRVNRSTPQQSGFQPKYNTMSPNYDGVQGAVNNYNPSQESYNQQYNQNPRTSYSSPAPPSIPSMLSMLSMSSTPGNPFAALFQSPFAARLEQLKQESGSYGQQPSSYEQPSGPYKQSVSYRQPYQSSANDLSAQRQRLNQEMSKNREQLDIINNLSQNAIPQNQIFNNGGMNIMSASVGQPKLMPLINNDNSNIEVKQIMIDGKKYLLKCNRDFR